MLWKMSLGETEIFLLQTISHRDFIMESVLMQLEMNQTLLESEIPDIELAYRWTGATEIEGVTYGKKIKWH